MLAKDYINQAILWLACQRNEKQVKQINVHAYIDKRTNLILTKQQVLLIKTRTKTRQQTDGFSQFFRGKPLADSTRKC